MEREVPASGFASAVASDIAADRRLLLDAAHETAIRAARAAVRKTNDEGLVHMGLFKASWKADRRPDGAEIRNDAPYAGVIEHGRRPGRPGPPLAPILEWVQRKLVANGEVKPEDAEDVARAIREKIHRKGSPAHLILASMEPQIERWFMEEVRRLLNRRR